MGRLKKVFVISAAAIKVPWLQLQLHFTAMYYRSSESLISLEPLFAPQKKKTYNYKVNFKTLTYFFSVKLGEITPCVFR